MNLLDLTEKWTDVRGHLPLLYAIARFLPVRLGLEIGVRDGNSTLAILMGLAAQETPDGLLISVDPEPCENAVARAQEHGLRALWNFRRQTSAQFSIDLSQEAQRRSFDLLFIDGSHDHADVLNDWLLWGPLVRKDGFILFHDTVTYDGPRRVVEEHIPQQRNLFEVCTLPYDHGLTIVRKKCDYWWYQSPGCPIPTEKP